MVRALYFPLLLMKLRPSIHSFYNRVCAQQCSESLAVRNLMNWFSSGFCMYGLGHADGRAPHIFFFHILILRIDREHILLDFSELNTQLTIRLGLFVFEHWSKIYHIFFCLRTRNSSRKQYVRSWKNVVFYVY